MPHPSASPRHLIGDRVAIAKIRTEQVHQDIERAEGQAQQATQVIKGKLADGADDPELAEAASHTAEVEEELREARAELRVVTELLESEERDRKRVEQALAEARTSQAPPAGARSGTGSASVIDHLRELTRHKLNTEVTETAPSPGRKAGPVADPGPR